MSEASYIHQKEPLCCPGLSKIHTFIYFILEHSEFVYIEEIED